MKLITFITTLVCKYFTINLIFSNRIIKSTLKAKLQIIPKSLGQKENALCNVLLLNTAARKLGDNYLKAFRMLIGKWKSNPSHSQLASLWLINIFTYISNNQASIDGIIDFHIPFYPHDSLTSCRQYGGWGMRGTPKLKKFKVINQLMEKFKVSKSGTLWSTK